MSVFRPDKKMTDVLKFQDFTLSAEIIPPRNGSEHLKIIHQIETLIQSGAQFLAVTKGAGGSLRGGSLPIAQTIKERFGVPCIAHFTCRDLTPPEVENHLMDHHYFGIRNILALRGDPPDGQPDWKARQGGYHYAYQLIEQIHRLNAGIYLSRASSSGTSFEANSAISSKANFQTNSEAKGASTDQERTDFCIGAAAYPDHPDEHERIHFFELKVKAGAQFGVTNLLFDPDSYGRFLDQCGKRGIHIPILPGTRVLKTRAQAVKMMTKFKVHVPSPLLDALPEHEEPGLNSHAIDLFLKLSNRLRALGAPGLHIYVISDVQVASQALRQLAEHIKRAKK